MKIKGLAWVTRKQPGKPILHFCYAWRGGPCIMKATGGPRPALTPEAVRLYLAAVDNRDAAPAHTLSAVAAAWRKSPEWRGMATSTRVQWGYKLAAIEEKWGAAPFHLFEDQRIRAKILDWRDGMASTPRSADYAIQVLSAFLAWATERGHLKRNHAAGIRQLYKGGQRAHIIWTPEERAIWQQAAPPIRNAFELACLTGLRRGDLVRLPWEAVGLNAIVWQPEKGQGKAIATIPLLPALKALLADLRSQSATSKTGAPTGPILKSETGKPYSVTGLTHGIARERDRLNLPAKHLHDCRGTFATELCLAGLTDQQIADILGWGASRVATIRRVYVDQAATVVAIGAALNKTKSKTRV